MCGGCGGVRPRGAVSNGRNIVTKTTKGGVKVVQQPRSIRRKKSG